MSDVFDAVSRSETYLILATDNYAKSLMTNDPFVMRQLDAMKSIPKPVLLVFAGKPSETSRSLIRKTFASFPKVAEVEWAKPSQDVGLSIVDALHQLGLDSERSH